MHHLSSHGSYSQHRILLPAVAARSATAALEQIPPLSPGSPERYVHVHDADHTQAPYAEDPKATAEATDDHDRGIRSRQVKGHRGRSQAGWRRRSRFYGQAAV